VTRLAITGHRDLPEETARLVDAALRAEIAKRNDGNLVGISCLADGADTLFAQAILDAGGTLIVVIPAKKYRKGLPKDHHPVYDRLLAQASNVIALNRIESGPDAHMEASVRLLAEADELIAIWDGQPARGYGGTADVVKAATQRRLPVTVAWPRGARRE
jgi:hypothetical protein